MVDLLPGQFDLDGFVFGSAGDSITVLADGFTSGWSTEPNDTRIVRRDIVVPGIDTVAPTALTLNISIRRDAHGDAHEKLMDLAAVWRSDDVRFTPGRVQKLRYRAGIDVSETRFVYGRADSLEYHIVDEWDYEEIEVQATFRVFDPNAYRDVPNIVRLDNLMRPTSAPFKLPMQLPTVIGPVNTTKRSGNFVVGGKVPTPFMVVIFGPQSGTAMKPRLVSSDGWNIEVQNTMGSGYAPILMANRAMTINTYEEAIGFSDNQGRISGYLNGRVSMQSRLSARLKPGPQELTFYIDDPSGTCYANVIYHDAYPLM